MFIIIIVIMVCLLQCAVNVGVASLNGEWPIFSMLPEAPSYWYSYRDTTACMVRLLQRVDFLIVHTQVLRSQSSMLLWILVTVFSPLQVHSPSWTICHHDCNQIFQLPLTGCNSPCKPCIFSSYNNNNCFIILLVCVNLHYFLVCIKSITLMHFI